jgi:hypothetical protein
VKYDPTRAATVQSADSVLDPYIAQLILTYSLPFLYLDSHPPQISLLKAAKVYYYLVC